MMAKINNVAILALLALAVVAMLLAEAPVSEAACSPVQLTPCAPAITGNRRPSGACCARLRQQRPCLCGYLRNPALRRYVNSPGAKRVAATCRIRVRC